MKKKLLLMTLLGFSTAFGGQGLLGSDLQYQHAVLITTAGVFIYAVNTCGSLAEYLDVFKHWMSAAIAGAAGLAVFYSNQFNDMIPERLRVNQSCDSLNRILPYWFAAIIAGATYSNFCDRYDAWFKPAKEEEKNKPNITFGIKKVQ